MPDEPRPRRGVRLAVDVGSVRVGLAASDPDGLLATPVATLRRSGPADPADDQIRIAECVAQLGAVEVVVGLPRSMSGGEGPAALAARDYAARLAALVAPVPVRLVDERLTTAGAHRTLRAAGRPGRRHRAVVDQVAAVAILQTVLDAERGASTTIGEPVRVIIEGTSEPTRDGTRTE